VFFRNLEKLLKIIKSLKETFVHVGDNWKVWAGFYNVIFHCEFLKLFFEGVGMYKL
jgi:hypothetical protein